MPVASPDCGGSGPWRAPAAASATTPRRRSFSALRATHRRNRYRTTRKPNFRATETGSSMLWRLLHDEPDVGGPERDARARLQRRGPRDAAAVDLDPVRGAHVLDDPAAP